MDTANMDNAKKLGNRQQTSVGARILVGVALASNIVIGSLLYINLQANATVERTVNEVLVIREELSDHLRRTIVDLQNEFLSLPALFRSNDRQAVLESIERDFRVVDNEVLTGRDNYQRHYSRQERRDLANGEFVIQPTADGVLLSYGVIDAAGAFTESVERKHLAASDPTGDATRVAATIAALSEQALSPEQLRTRIRELSRRSADIGLKAELSRNEILYTVDEIRAKERQLAETRTKVRQFTLGMGVVAIIANMAIIFFLVRLIVDRPLHRLAQSLEELNPGSFAAVPGRNHRDQIGVLSEAIGHFREVLIKLQNENLRRTRDKSIVDESIDMVAGVIHTLEGRARELVEMSARLSEQAAAVEIQSGAIPVHAGQPADQSQPPHRQAMAGDDGGQIETRETAVQDILDRSRDSRIILERMTAPIGEIGDTITAVREIAGQTKFLAMNATIQAERGGDATQKLGIFANDIWELSFNTGNAAKVAMARVEQIERENSTLTSTLQEIDSRIVAIGNIIIDSPPVVAGRQAETAGSAVPANIDAVHSAAARSRELSRQVCRHANEIATQLATLLHETTTRLHQLGRKEDMPQLSTFTLALDRAGGKA